MSVVPDKVLNWLYSVLTSEYRDVNRTYSDAADALSQYPSLTPRTEVYTYENGSSALLLHLTGTLPVQFRGTLYRFPIALWIPHAYPHEPPMAYVTPAQDMAVRPGQNHVGGDGRVYHPYLANWGKFWDRSSISDFLTILQGVFAKEPPVASKNQQQQYAPQSSTVHAAPPVPPPPEELRSSVRPPQTGSPIQRATPVPPPKPLKPHEASSGIRNGPGQQRLHAPPPVPPLPPGVGTPHGQRISASGWHEAQLPQHLPQRQASLEMRPPPPLPPPQTPSARFPQIPSSAGSPVPPGVRPPGSAPRYQNTLPPPQPPSGYAPLRPPSQLSRPPANQIPQQPAQPVYHHQLQHPQYIGPPAQQQLPKAKVLHPIPDLLSSPLDVTLPSQTGPSIPLPLPPVPPNPEKDALLTALSTSLVSQIRRTVEENNSALPALQAQHSALLAATSRLQSELSQLQQLDAALASNEKILREAMREADRVMEDARNRKVPDVDEVLVAGHVVGNQLYSLVAEEKACADAVVCLGRGLDRGVVGVEGFVKQCRAVAREQFLKKMLIKKIERGMGLDGV
ncbi:hypothetical protein W97_03154 [Coniosporium apollinis CBS 100218]|uniref:UEV domain-containing protein n=1 Tax=Coniosporium apollinis (strain CBS 100218) TaxID=1168221 RepID=R7YQH1_CONA1|nr:uncharacterized protein W97_03154 [Coniosporium apollinis CBS 100218]EON63926.1 hypothetical protein W97_03154 [Coniosporium apollinis CBS 100218]